MSDFLSTKDVAELLGVKEVTVRHWRYKLHPRRHPVTLPWHRIGGKVFYAASDVLEFIRLAKVTPSGRRRPDGEPPSAKDRDR